MWWPGSGVVEQYGCRGLSLVIGLGSFQLAGDGSTGEAAHQMPRERTTCSQLAIPLATTQNALTRSGRTVSSPSQLWRWLLHLPLREGKSEEWQIRVSCRIIGPELVLI